MKFSQAFFVLAFGLFVSPPRDVEGNFGRKIGHTLGHGKGGPILEDMRGAGLGVGRGQHSRFPDAWPLGSMRGSLGGSVGGWSSSSGAGGPVGGDISGGWGSSSGGAATSGGWGSSSGGAGISGGWGSSSVGAGILGGLSSSSGAAGIPGGWSSSSGGAGMPEGWVSPSGGAGISGGWSSSSGEGGMSSSSGASGPVEGGISGGWSSSSGGAGIPKGLSSSSAGAGIPGGLSSSSAGAGIPGGLSSSSAGAGIPGGWSSSSAGAGIPGGLSSSSAGAGILGGMSSSSGASGPVEGGISGGWSSSSAGAGIPGGLSSSSAGAGIPGGLSSSSAGAGIPGASGANVGSQGSANILYPYGTSEGDQTTPLQDDGHSPLIPISTEFTFFNKKYNSLYVNNNGVVSFGVPVAKYTPDAFPLSDGSAFVAPYWGDVNNVIGGTVYYRDSTEPGLLKRVSADINSYFPNIQYTAQWAFVATWDKVAYYGSQSSRVNTFQAVLTTDGRYAYIILNYGNIQWTTGTASKGEPLTGLGGIPAQAGFNSGDETHYFNIPGSRSPEVLNIARTSNVNVPGRWVFRVDSFKVPGGCVAGVNFAKFGDIFWKDDACEEKCVCQNDGDTKCTMGDCSVSEVCKQSTWFFVCQSPDSCISN